MHRNTTDRPRGASWNWHSPEAREKEIVSFINDNFSNESVEFVDTKGLGIGNLIFDSASTKQAIERMKNENVDAVVIINCNFGNEEVAGDIALALGNAPHNTLRVSWLHVCYISLRKEKPPQKRWFFFWQG